jgi:hypothetical protein
VPLPTKSNPGTRVPAEGAPLPVRAGNRARRRQDGRLRLVGGSLAPVEVPAPDANKLLASWMEWERGDVTPGRVMANLKTGGLRELLEGLSTQSGAPAH